MEKISLKAARVNAGYSQTKAASLLNISRRTIQNWERGISFPDAAAIEKICALYRMHYDNISFCPTIR